MGWKMNEKDGFVFREYFMVGQVGIEPTTNRL